MENQIFRKKSLESLSAPEELNEYLHVTKPAIWAVLISVIVLIAGAFLWGSFTTIDSKATGTAEVSDGVVVVNFDNQNLASHVQTGMTLVIGDETVPITSVGADNSGKIIAGAKADMPDGRYACSVTYKNTKVLELLFN